MQKNLFNQTENLSNRLFKTEFHNEIFKSVFEDQNLLIQTLLDLHNNGEKIHLDPMFNQGGFYKKIVEMPLLAGDINKKYQTKFVKNLDATNLKNINNLSIKSMILDPPFLFGVPKRNPNHVGISYHQYSKNTIDRFSTFKDKKALLTFYKKIIDEAFRVLIKKGLLIFKCQDINKEWIHIDVFNLLSKANFKVVDLAILNIENKIFNPNLKQRILRKTHSYFWVAKKKSK